MKIKRLAHYRGHKPAEYKVFTTIRKTYCMLDWMNLPFYELMKQQGQKVSKEVEVDKVVFKWHIVTSNWVSLPLWPLKLRRRRHGRSNRNVQGKRSTYRR